MTTGERLKTHLDTNASKYYAPVQKKFTTREWNARYARDVRPLMDAIGGERNVVGYVITKTLRKLRDSGKPTTPTNLRAELAPISRVWKNALKGKGFHRLEGVIEYYEAWDKLPRYRKQEITKARRGIP